MPSPLSSESSLRPPPVPKGSRKPAPLSASRSRRTSNAGPDPGSDSESESESESDELASIIAALDRAAQRKGLSRSLAVAQILVSRLYGGVPDAFRSREGKTGSLRKLVKNGAPLSATALYRALAVHEIWVRVRGHRWPQLGASHYRAVESLSPGEQEAWLAAAATKDWSAARLRQSIVTSGVVTAARGGRLPTHPLARLVVRLERELARADGIASRIDVPAHDQKRMTDLADRLDLVSARCLEYAMRLRRAVARATGPHNPNE